MEKNQAAAAKVQPPSHPLTSVLAFTRTVELVSNLCLLGIVSIYTYRHFKTYWPLYYRRMMSYFDLVSDFAQRTIDVILGDEDYPNTEDLNEILTEEYFSDEADFSETVDTMPEGWEFICKSLENFDGNDSEYDTSSEDRVSLSSMDDIEFSTPALSRRSEMIKPMEQNDEKCCKCQLPKKSETKPKDSLFLPESVLQKRAGQNLPSEEH